MNLRPYQTESISELSKGFANKHKRQILALTTGAGKTVVFSEMVKQAAQKGTRTMIFTDRIELFAQTFKTLERKGIKPQIINAKTKFIDNTALITIAMIETIKRRKHELNPKLIIIDECFVAGTKIDGKNIEEIKVGDYVNSYNHYKKIVEKKKVLALKKTLAKDDLLLISFQDEQFVCTRKHPIFVKNKGYINAEKLNKNDIVYRLHDLHQLPKKHIKREFSNKIMESKMLKSKKWFSDILFKNMQRFCFRSREFNKNEKKQSYVESGISRKNEENIKINWAQAYKSWGKWQRIYRTTKEIITSIGRKLASRICDFNWKWIFAISLQNRYSKSNTKDSNRNRWEFSSKQNSENERQKKRRIIVEQRIQNIEIYKQICDGKCGSNSKYNYVYNFEVEDNNNYFANNILVHNCHRGNFTKLFEIFPNAYIVGATATPVGKHIPKYYTNIVQTIDTPDLIQQSYLSPYIGFQMQDDFSDLKIKGNEYSEESLFNHYHQRKHYDGVIEEYKKRANGKKAIVFNVNIAHTEAMTAEFNKAGIESYCVTSKTPALERERILRAFTLGMFPVLNNCGILTTGYDEPSIECVIMNRKTLSLPLWLQCCGRGSRIHPNKTHFVVLDFGMNHSVHGMWDEPREWTLKEKKRKKQAAPTKDCPECDALNYASARICKACGHEFEVNKNEELKKGVMVQITPTNLIGKKISQLSLEELKELQIRKKYKPSFVWRVVRNRGVTSLEKYAELMGYSSGWVWKQKQDLVNSTFKDYVIK